MTGPSTPEFNSLVSPTSSRSVTETVNGTHKFVIEGYSLAKGMGIGKHIASENFTVGGYQWAVYFYPDGKNPEDNSAYVSVFIALASDGTDVRALFELKLVDQSGKNKDKIHSHFDRALESGPYTLKYRGSMWGYKRFFRRTSLEQSDYLKDDCLIFQCTVGVVVSAIDCSRLHPIQVPESDIGMHFGMLLDNMEGSDVVINVDGEKFHAHKLVLAARSPVFRSEFFEKLNEDKHEIVLTNMEPKVFKVMSPSMDMCLYKLIATLLKQNKSAVMSLMGAWSGLQWPIYLPGCNTYFPSTMLVLPYLYSCLQFLLFLQAILHFIYTDKLVEEDDLDPSSSCPESSMRGSLVVKLLEASDTYGLTRLRRLCESCLCKEISVNSVCEILALADCHHATELKAICLKFAAENLAAVMRTDGFIYFKENCPSLQSELLKAVAGCEEECSSGGGKSRSVWAQLSDGGDSNGRRVRQRT